MAEASKKGTVTPLNSLFTSEEAKKATRRVEEAIADSHKELFRLRGFISDNSALIQQIRKLPEELCHEIMVPFGGAAFFPGRLIHTNEFLVLFGEGYYAERSAKQTVEILQRRGKSLEAHVDSLNRVMKDLEVESRFFDSTAAEVDEGLVEIREEYVEETSKEPKTGLSNASSMISSKTHNSGVPNKEDVDAKLMAMLDELEKEEEEAVSDFGDDEDDETASSSDVDAVQHEENESSLMVDEDEDDEEEDDEEEDDEEESDDDEYHDDNARYLNACRDDDDEDELANENAENISGNDGEVLMSKATDPRTFAPTSMQQHNAISLLEHPSDQFSVSTSKMQVAPEGSLKSTVKQTHATQPPSLPSQTREYLQKTPPSNVQAFTGTVIEHSYGPSPAKASNDSTSGQPSRPVSRFKMQKGVLTK